VDDQVNVKNLMGFTPLHISVFAFNESLDHTPQIERDLLASGANINSQDGDTRTPLFYLFFKYEEIKGPN
jgi:ankyrin repeat protein